MKHNTEGEKTPIVLLGVKIDNFTSKQLLEAFVDALKHNEKKIISYVNIHAVNLAYRNKRFKTFINCSDVVFCDGFGVKYAVCFVYKQRIDRYTPPDFIGEVCDLAIKHKKNVFLLGGRQGVSASAARRLVEKYHGVCIDSYHGYFDKKIDSAENKYVIQKINNHKTDILIVGFGMPLQEDWIEQNRDKLNVKIFFPAGAIFDYISGDIRRAPRWMTENGLEWLGRLIFEPGRLWKRYIIGNPLFLWRLFIHHVIKIPLPD